MQVITRIYIGSQKQYFHMDESYSYGLMNYDKLNIADNEDFYQQWHTSAYYKDYLVVNEEELWNLKPVYENQKNDVHPPFYYLLLRIGAMFSVNHFSKWTGIILNIVIFIISSIFVYLIANQLFKNRIYSLLVCVVNGFTLLSLESSIYIRMYELSNLNILIITYLHLKIRKEEQLNFKKLCPMTIALVIGGLTHYYYFIYAFIIYLLFTYQLIRTKNYKNLIRYQAAVLVAAIIYLLIFPYAIEHILFSYRGVGNVKESEGFIQDIGTYLFILSKEMTNHFIGIIIVVVYLLCKNKKKNHIPIKKEILLVILPTIVYFILVAKNSPYTEMRYIIPIYSVTTISLIYLIKTYLRKFWDNKSTLFLLEMIFIVMLYSPKMTGQKLEFTYEKYHDVVTTVKENNIPIIYVFNKHHNRFLDDIYLFTLVDTSIILDYEALEENKEILKEKEEFFLMYNEGTDIDKIKSYLPEYREDYIQKMNACDIIKMEK